MTTTLVYGIVAAFFTVSIVSAVVTCVDLPQALYDGVECATICAATIGVLVATYFTIVGLAAALL